MSIAVSIDRTGVVTSRGGDGGVVCLLQLRERLEAEMQMELRKYKAFIDEEMMLILGQMDSPSLVFDFLYLGSEWNASNFEELKANGSVNSCSISSPPFPAISH